MQKTNWRNLPPTHHTAWRQLFSEGSHLSTLTIIHDKPTACVLSSLIRSRTRTLSFISVAQYIFERLFQSIRQGEKNGQNQKEKKEARAFLCRRHGFTHRRTMLCVHQQRSRWRNYGRFEPWAIHSPGIKGMKSCSYNRMNGSKGHWVEWVKMTVLGNMGS